MQSYTPLLPTGIISRDRQKINENFDTLASNFSGTYFPTSNLFEGMRCWRTDQKKMYQLSANLTTWVLVDDLSAGYNRVERANKSDMAEKDGAGNIIANTYSKKSDTGSIVLQCYPVGSIYMSVNATSPATLFGGSWQQISGGRVLIGSNSSYRAGATGGSETHTLSVSNLPAHSHSTTHSLTAASNGNHTHTRGTMNITGSFQGAGYNEATSHASGAFTVGGLGAKVENDHEADYYYNFDASKAWTGATSSDGAHTHTISGSVTVNNTGNGAAVSNMQPYLVVNMWQRIA